MPDRKPSVAGRFYPFQEKQLQEELQRCFSGATPYLHVENLRALVAPHAGYIFSGAVAASAYNQIPPGKTFKRVFILASSHYLSFSGASVYCSGNYETPLGKVPVDMDLGQELVHNCPVFSSREDAHQEEHSIEVQLPFLQQKLGKSFLLVPIVIGTNTISEVVALADALRQYFTEENLFVVSTDFSHYPAYADACKVDSVTLEAILKNDPELFMEVRQKNRSGDINNLATDICGWTAMLTLLSITGNNRGLHYRSVMYKNSGDSKEYGDLNRVVGYHALLVEGANPSDFMLSDADKKQLLSIARTRLEAYLKGEKYVSPTQCSEALKSSVGAFTSIYANGELRGCIGRFISDNELAYLVEELIVSTVHDGRFVPVEASDLPNISIEISVLTPLRRIKSPDEFQLGLHGIYIRKGDHSGTFLPQVAEKTGWNKEEFLGHCAADKAQIGYNGWKTAELYTYEAIVFSEKSFR